MSPYQQEVMDTTLAEFDRQQAINQTGLRDQAIGAGAYGGARQGIMQQQFMNQGAIRQSSITSTIIKSRIYASTTSSGQQILQQDKDLDNINKH